MNNTLKGYATETWVLKRLSKFKATSSSTSGAQIVGSTHEHANKETLDKLTEDMIKVLGTLSIDENGHLCSSVGLYSQSFVSAFGLNPSSGGSGGGGAASIIVNGNQYTPNADGVITLPDYPTSLTWSNIQGKPSWIGSTKPTYTASEVGALPSNHPASDVTSALIANWNAAYNWGNHANAGYLKSITKTLVVNALGYTPFNNASFTKANIKSTLGISDWALASSKPSYNLDEVADGTSRKLSNYLLKSVFNDMFEKVTENGVTYIKAKYNFASVGFVSAFGLNPSSGGSGGGGAASIIVNGNQYTPNADGVITLPDYPTSLTWSNIEGKPSWIGSTKPTYTASEVGALASNHPASDVTSALITNWNAAYNWGNHANAGYLKSITKTLVVNALGYTPFNNASFTKANIKSTLGISDWALAASKPKYSASEIVNYLGYTPFDKASFTKANIKSTLGISDWALAASKPTYNLDEVADGTSRKLSNYLLKSVFNDMFEKVTESGVAYIKAKYNLTVSGSILATSNITAYSDARLKDKVKRLEYRGRLSPVTYVWKNDRSRQQIGFIAQDVQKLYPELVQDNKGLLSLNYQCVTAVLAAQLNAMGDEMCKMKREITELKEMINQKI